MEFNTVGFYLPEVFELWFHNNEASINTWSAFKARFTDVFGGPPELTLRAEQRLLFRAQQGGETFASYIKDVLDVRRRLPIHGRR